MIAENLERSKQEEDQSEEVNSVIPTVVEEEILISAPSPAYPELALSRGIEGWCEVMFTVERNGRVVSPIVVISDPPEIFDAASLDAVENFIYTPRFEDGVAVAIPEVKYIFRFNLR